MNVYGNNDIKKYDEEEEIEEHEERSRENKEENKICKETTIKHFHTLTKHVLCIGVTTSEHSVLLAFHLKNGAEINAFLTTENFGTYISETIGRA